MVKFTPQNYWLREKIGILQDGPIIMATMYSKI